MPAKAALNHVTTDFVSSFQTLIPIINRLCVAAVENLPSPFQPAYSRANTHHNELAPQGPVIMVELLPVIKLLSAAPYAFFTNMFPLPGRVTNGATFVN